MAFDTSATTQGQPRMRVIRITPQMAAEYLEGNSEGNRNLRAGVVDFYAREMLAGNWTLSNDAICFNGDGRLINGQHRLAAVVKADMSQHFNVMTGVPDEWFPHLDTGLKRTASDFLGILGESDRALLASTLRQCVLWEQHRLALTKTGMGGARVSNDDLAKFLDEHPEVRESVAKAAKFRARVDIPPTSIAASHWIISQVAGAKNADEFWLSVYEQTDLPAGSPVLALLSRTRGIRRHNVNMTPGKWIGLIFRAYNYWIADIPVGMIQIPQSVVPKVAHRTGLDPSDLEVEDEQE